jgi:hypothetical protein
MKLDSVASASGDWSILTLSFQFQTFALILISIEGEGSTVGIPLLGSSHEIADG